MDDYFVGALLQLLERARHLNTRVPRNLEREFHTLVTTCQAEVTRIVNTVRFLLDEPAIRLPANQPERLRMFRRAVADLDVVETVGFAAIERANKEDIRLNRLMDRIRLEIRYPLLPPVVTSLSQAYFRIFPSLNLLCVPLTEGRFLLHLPDLFHEIGHPLLSTANNPVVEPFRQALNRVLQAAMVYLDGETRAQERRRGPSRMLFTLECWARSWVSWSVEFLCDLFGAFTVGPAFAWSHLHLSAKRGGDPYLVPALAPTSHPPDAARMTLVLKGLARCGFTAEIARIQDRWRDFIAIAEGRPERGEKQAVDHAIGHSFVREAVVPERKVITEALKRGIGAVTVEDVTREVGKRSLIRSEIAGRRMATTKEMLALESRLIDYAREGRGRCRPLGNPDRPCSRDWFNDGQKADVRHVLGSRDRVMIVRGVAGTGKTTLEQEIGEALAEAGKPVVAIAQSTKARDVLRAQAGLPAADTVAMFLVSERMQEAAREGVILVDEASQLGTRDMDQVFSVAEKVGACVVLVGDRRQHRSVTAGEPLKLLEDRAGLRVAEVTEILRQQGDYKKAAQALSEGRTGEAFDELDKLGWIRQVGGADRSNLLAAAYLAAVTEKKKNGEHKSALVVSPTHAEARGITDAIRGALKSQGKLSKECVVTAWVPTHLTDAQKTDLTEYEPGDLLQFHQNAKGYTKGARLIVGGGAEPPIELAQRFEVYRPVQLALAVGDRIRITAGGKTRDGKHRLTNGSLFTVEGFTRRGDIIVDGGWIIDRDFGHLTHGYVLTSHASEGDTVDKVFVAISSQSLPATNQRTAYVALTRGKEQAILFTDDRKELLKAMSRPDDPMSATELAKPAQEKPSLRDRLMRRLAFARGLGIFGQRRDSMQQGRGDRMAARGLDHA